MALTIPSTFSCLLGRYKAGEKEPDPKTWKANFRCAMNSLPDIEEVKDQSRNKGSSAVRVYRMLPPLSKIQKKGMQGLWVLRKPSGREGERGPTGAGMPVPRLMAYLSHREKVQVQPRC